MNIIEQISEAADKAGCSSTANDISCNFKTKMKMFEMMAEIKEPIKKNTIYWISIMDQNIKIGNRNFTIHTLESIKDGQILIENDISDGNGVIIEV